jgi:hypothetical protein
LQKYNNLLKSNAADSEIIAQNNNLIFHFESLAEAKTKACYPEVAGFSVVQPGFEPRQAEPKSAVLPLHHWTMFLYRNGLQKYIISESLAICSHKKYEIYF